MTIIHATGVSEQHYRAERATITAQISITSTDRSASINGATDLHNRIAQRARQLRDNGDATWHSAGAISTWARKSYAEGSKSKVVTEHVTSSRVRVKLSNLPLVSAIVTEFSEAGAETSVEWALTDTTRRAHERSGRKRAVGIAREIAGDYAEALGERVVRVVSISDQRNYGGPQVRAASMGAGSGVAAEVTVAEITVTASVEGEFESA